MSECWSEKPEERPKFKWIRTAVNRLIKDTKVETLISCRRGEETRSGTEKRCSHNLQSGHRAWWSADNYSIFPTVNILEARIEANRQRKSEMLKKMKKIISCIAYLSFGTELPKYNSEKQSRLRQTCFCFFLKTVDLWFFSKCAWSVRKSAGKTHADRFASCENIVWI